MMEKQTTLGEKFFCLVCSRYKLESSFVRQDGEISIVCKSCRMGVLVDEE